MTLADLPPLRESLETHGLIARKSFGQHFLLDLNVTRKIARLAGPLDGQTVIEVGPGPGGLTRALLEAGARVIAIEKDERFMPLLAELADAAPGRLTLVRADAYGRLSVITQATSAARLVMDLPARAFTPPPKVDSAVVRLDPLPAPPPAALIAALERVTAAAFGQRRKMLRSSLKTVGGDSLCIAAGLDSNQRAETVPVAGFLRLAEELLNAS